jgi:hypothetical protein
MRNKFDVHEFVNRDIIMNKINEMQLYRLIYYSWSALYVSGDVFAHHQEHLTVFTATLVNNNRCCKYSQVLLKMDENIPETCRAD